MWQAQWYLLHKLLPLPDHDPCNIVTVQVYVSYSTGLTLRLIADQCCAKWKQFLLCCQDCCLTMSLTLQPA